MPAMNYRGLAYTKFRNVSEFAKAIGWSRNKASRILNGVQEPDANDMEKMANVLDIKTAEQFTAIFFISLSTKWTENKS